MFSISGVFLIYGVLFCFKYRRSCKTFFSFNYTVPHLSSRTNSLRKLTKPLHVAQGIPDFHYETNATDEKDILLLMLGVT